MKGIVIKYPDCIMDEVEPTIELLQELVEIDVVDLSQVSAQIDCDFLIIPGGACDLAIEHAALKALIRKVKNNSGLLAGICNGALVLASSGVLRGEKCTHTAHPKYAPLREYKELLDVAKKLFHGSEYIDEDLVISKNIITAKPHVPDQFANAIRCHLGV